ncbi:membrane-bound lytic murein transglycosylase MltF [Betaproteobacteria bacterium SCN2]|jgi:membrane-bound lytic murein transglycosylase F|nr:membrane-bound lytic murein transglycosylase MltF [Betaproteobacteria bacterium SCN2]
MIRALCLGWLVLMILQGCSRPVPDPDTSKELVVSVPYGPATFYLDPEGKPAGYTYDVVQAFAAKHDWTVKWQETQSYSAPFASLRNQESHLVAANLIAASVDELQLLPGPMLFETRVVVVTRYPVPKIRNLADLARLKIGVALGAGHISLLDSARRKYPKLKWTVLEDIFPEGLLAKLDENEFDAVVVNEQDFDLARNQYPALRIAYELSRQEPVVWALPHDIRKSLLAKLNRFFIEARRDGTLRQIYERHYGHVKRLEPAHAEGILMRRLSILPRYRSLFHTAQEQTALDWRLLAAIGYQESKWDPYATSPTGVRGLMMLTGDTADRMGVTDRLDARQSILGGSKYLVLLKDTLPDRIAEPDRTWLALAAYNQGIGHLEDARRIAQSKGMDPDSWADVKQTLPLLARGGYEKVTKYGYARGGEAVIFVESIRNYYDILLRLEPEHKPLLMGQAGREKLALN